jgi:hypothetical protein
MGSQPIIIGYKAQAFFKTPVDDKLGTHLLLWQLLFKASWQQEPSFPV